jgi:hypothetical protein
MEWQRTAAGRHILQEGEYIGEVWQTTDGTWIGRVETERYAPSMGRFPTFEDAQAWCTTLLGTIHAGESDEQV